MAMDRSSRPMHRGRKKVCSFCVDRVEHIDYKDLPRLRKYVSERAKIIPRRVTGTCAFHQRELTYLNPSKIASIQHHIFEIQSLISFDLMNHLAHNLYLSHLFRIPVT